MPKYKVGQKIKVDKELAKMFGVPVNQKIIGIEDASKGPDGLSKSELENLGYWSYQLSKDDEQKKEVLRRNKK